MSKPGRLLAGVLIIATAVLAAAGCASAASPPPVGPITPGSPAGFGELGLPPAGVASTPPQANPRLLGAADTAFGLDLLGAWCRSQPAANLVFSPQSLAAGLGLAYLGARGPTATAMAGVLHLPAASLPQTEADMRARQAALGGLDRAGVTLDTSNRIWTDPSLVPLRSYLDAAATAYDAGLSQVPLPSDPARAAQVINAAIARDTRGHIRDLLSPTALDGDDWVLTDALYLDADWAAPFAPGQTEPGPFTTAAGRTATAWFMHGGGYRYATADGWTAVGLPYRGGRLAMTALLPPAGTTGCQVPAAPALSRLAGAVAAGGGLVSVALPRVNLSTHQTMNSLLTRLGMGLAFGEAADFTGLSPAAGNISVVVHAATLQVAEKGTVGSAATAVGVTPAAAMASPIHQIDFDRPYLMLVTDTVTGEPLFIARVTDPATPLRKMCMPGAC